MEGAEVANSQNSDAVLPAEVSAAIVTIDKNSGTHRVAFDKKIRESPAYRLVEGESVKVTVMTDGEIRIKKLADTA